MSGNGKKRTPLVADRRYRNAKSKPVAKAKTSAKAAKRAKPKTRRATRPKRGLIGGLMAIIGGAFWLLLRTVWGIGWRISVVVALLIAGGVAYYSSQLPDMAELIDGRARGSVTLLDREGQTFAWRGDQFGGMITADSVSTHLANAIIATEDKRFYWHPGIDPRGIASAVRINLREGRGPLSGNGGSTLTQQTAKLLCLGRPYDPETWESENAYEADCRRTTIWRKIQEALFAMALEVSYSKDDILTIYMNRAYLGAGARGFEAASQRYFGISAAEVDPAQAAMLAGLLKAPTTYAPTNSLERAQNRAAVVIGLMEVQGYLSSVEAELARINPAQLSAAASQQAGGYFADWVMATGPEFFTRDTTEDVIIRTTLDQRIQQATEQAVTNVFEDFVSEESVAQTAVIVMSADGAVRAMVGGRDFRSAGLFNRATTAVRQPGSAFKPFIYAAALDLGHGPNDVLMDEPTCWTTPGSGEWCPQNYDRQFRGPVTLTQALMSSYNIPAILLSETVGRDNVRAVAAGFGIQSDLSNGPALALGVSESTLIEMTGAYAGILNGGSAVTPYGLVELRLLGDDALIMGQGGGIGERVIREEAAQQLTWMMYQVIQGGTGTRAQIDGWEMAGKSGTTDQQRDAWFIGFSGDYVVGVWMGNDDNSPLRGVTGGGLPAEIWRQTMEGVLAEVPLSRLPMATPVGQGETLLVADSLSISDAELDRLLQEEFGAPAVAPVDTGAAPTDATIDNILDNIFSDR